MPGEQNREQNEQNRKRGRDEAFSNPNVELAGLNKPAGQPGTSEETLNKVGQVLQGYFGLPLPQVLNFYPPKSCFRILISYFKFQFNF